MRLGFIVILIGSLYLLKNMGLIAGVSWSILWPVITIFIGIAIVARKTHGHGKWCDCRKCSGVKGADCACDCASCKTCQTK